jgi:hypothetical protein
MFYHLVSIHFTPLSLVIFIKRIDPDAGGITQAEYDAQKKKLLAQ